MSIFRRKQEERTSHDGTGESLEELEQNPELLAAEESVNRLPPPPPSMNPLMDVWTGPRPRLVEFIEEEDSLPPKS